MARKKKHVIRASKKKVVRASKKKTVRRASRKKTARRARSMSAPGDVWSPNHLACANTWAYLRFDKQLNGDFASSGDVKMNALAYWNPAASPAARRLEAQLLSGKLDSFFRKALLARFEAGKDFAAAIQEMSDTLVDEDKAVRDLAIVVDALYRFRGEA